MLPPSGLGSGDALVPLYSLTPSTHSPCLRVACKLLFIGYVRFMTSADPTASALENPGQNRADTVDDHLRARAHTPHHTSPPRARPQPPTPSALRLQCLCAGLSPTLGLYPCPYPSSIGHAMRWFGGVSVLPARLWRAYTSRVPLWQHTLQWP